MNKRILMNTLEPITNVFAWVTKTIDRHAAAYTITVHWPFCNLNIHRISCQMNDRTVTSDRNSWLKCLGNVGHPIAYSHADILLWISPWKLPNGDIQMRTSLYRSKHIFKLKSSEILQKQQFSAWVLTYPSGGISNETLVT